MASLHDVTLSTSASTVWIDEWCGAHCRGNWSVSVDTVLNRNERKEVTVSFECPEERDAFRAYQKRPAR